MPKQSSYRPILFPYQPIIKVTTTEQHWTKQAISFHGYLRCCLEKFRRICNTGHIICRNDSILPTKSSTMDDSDRWIVFTTVRFLSDDTIDRAYYIEGAIFGGRSRVSCRLWVYLVQGGKDEGDLCICEVD